ncbi:MAG: sulfatase-like hydrolase/transferase [Sphingobacteriales bacterium]|nr:MAG: sulfatase-like hydrolase/transferase [Sphingobacteriales bacterium]
MNGNFSNNSSVPTGFPLRLTLNTLGLLLILKCWFFISLHNKMSWLYLLSYVQDAFLFMVNYLLFIYCFQTGKWLYPLGFMLFVLFFIPISALTFTYTFFLMDLYHFPMNIFSISADSLCFFITYFTSPFTIAGFLGIYAVLFSISYLVPKRLAFVNWIKPACLLLTLLFLPSSLKPGINPILFSIQEQIIAYRNADTNLKHLEEPNAEIADNTDFGFADKKFDTIPTIHSNYKRVIVLVMEGLNYKTFTQKSKEDQNSFLNKYQKHIKQFTNYHTLNIDSFTSLIAILNSIFVPYSSHVKKEAFDFTDKQTNLVRFFNHNHFTTFFTTSLGLQQAYFVPDMPEWKTTLFMEKMDTVVHYKCINSMKIENSCEDLTLLNNMVDTIAAHDQIFVFNEMVYGHVNEWTEKKGVEVVEYYNLYFNRLIEKLSGKQILDSTLIFILSDHGPKEDAYNTDNYHIPLLVFSTGIDTTANNSFTSHLDFKNILIELMTGTPQIYGNQPFFTYGNSVEMVYGLATPDGSHIFINNRLRQTKGNLSDRNEYYKLNKHYQQYLHYFASLKAKI